MERIHEIALHIGFDHWARCVLKAKLGRAREEIVAYDRLVQRKTASLNKAMDMLEERHHTTLKLRETLEMKDQTIAGLQHSLKSKRGEFQMLPPEDPIYGCSNTVYGKDKIIGNLLKANERLRSALSSAEVKASKAEREVSRLEDENEYRMRMRMRMNAYEEEGLAAPVREVEEDIGGWVEDLDLNEASEVEEEFMSDCDSDSDWVPGCD